MYSKEETNSLLGTITHILPVGPDTCKEVAELHVGEFPSMLCKPEGLVVHHEFCSLHTKEIKTGDSLCPAKVCHAKNIMKDIEDKMDTAVYVDNDESGIPDPINDDQVPIQDWTTTNSNVSVSTPCLVHVAAMICKLKKLPQIGADDDCNSKMSCLMTKRRNMKRNKKKEEHEKEQGKRKGRG